MNYTKGEWTVWMNPDRIPPEGEGFWAIYVADGKGKVIAKVSRNNTDEIKAIAQLIAAAPDMYEALKELLFRFAINTDLPSEKDKEVYELADKALVKAEGKEGQA